MNIKTAFLNGDIEEEIYMVQPDSFKVKSLQHLVCKLKKSIYGLKQASRQWYLKFDQVISNFGFKENIVDQCIHHKFKESRLIFLVLYVDDILLASDDMVLLLDTKSLLSKNFEMKDLGEASFVIGIQIQRDRTRGILGLSQKPYIDKVLDRCGMKNCSKGDKLSLL